DVFRGSGLDVRAGQQGEANREVAQGHGGEGGVVKYKAVYLMKEMHWGAAAILPRERCATAAGLPPLLEWIGAWLNVVRGEPAEGDDLVGATVGAVGGGERGRCGGGGVGRGIDVVGQTLHEGLAPGGGLAIGRVGGVEGFAVGANHEGVGAGGERGAEGLQNVALQEPAGQAGGGAALRAGRGFLVEEGVEVGQVHDLVGVVVLFVVRVGRGLADAQRFAAEEHAVAVVSGTLGGDAVAADGLERVDTGSFVVVAIVDVVDGGLERAGEAAAHGHGVGGEVAGGVGVVDQRVEVGAGGDERAVDEVGERDERAAGAHAFDDLGGEGVDLGEVESSVAGVGVVSGAGGLVAGAGEGVVLGLPEGAREGRALGRGVVVHAQGVESAEQGDPGGVRGGVDVERAFHEQVRGGVGGAQVGGGGSAAGGVARVGRFERGSGGGHAGEKVAVPQRGAQQVGQVEVACGVGRRAVEAHGAAR